MGRPSACYRYDDDSNNHKFAPERKMNLRESTIRQRRRQQQHQNDVQAKVRTQLRLPLGGGNLDEEEAISRRDSIRLIDGSCKDSAYKKSLGCSGGSSSSSSSSCGSSSSSSASESFCGFSNDSNNNNSRIRCHHQHQHQPSPTVANAAQCSQYQRPVVSRSSARTTLGPEPQRSRRRQTNPTEHGSSAATATSCESNFKLNQQQHQSPKCQLPVYEAREQSDRLGLLEHRCCAGHRCCSAMMTLPESTGGGQLSAQETCWRPKDLRSSTDDSSAAAAAAAKAAVSASSVASSPSLDDDREPNGLSSCSSSSGYDSERVNFLKPSNERRQQQQQQQLTKRMKVSSAHDGQQQQPAVERVSPARTHPRSPHSKLMSLGERNGQAAAAGKQQMPWFGIDVGGSLVKVVFFDPKDASRDEMVTLKRIRRYLKSFKPYGGATGKRDTHLEMANCVINKRAGTLHFIRFATSQMPEFLSMAKSRRFADTIDTVCATGGGAYKFEEDIRQQLGITLRKTDEMDSIIYGIHYIDKYNADRECYFLDEPLDDAKCVKVPYDFSRPYPYLVVNIGSGVSILAVYSSTSYSRISGSSIGGGTFLGLCSLLAQCKTFDEAIGLAKAGSSSKIDKLVKDIYGGDYPKFNLSGDTVASSFGHMNMAEKRQEVRRQDLARALLEMVTINIGSIARMCAANEDIDRVVFIGNFLRVNQLSMKLLSYAVNYWSKGAMKALFLEHEGYFGAVGCFVESLTQGVACH